MRAIVMTASFLALTACQTQMPEEEASAPGGTCTASELQAFVGQPLSALAVENIPGPVRVIGPDTAVTMDYREDRLNIEHDNSRTITRIACG